MNVVTARRRAVESRVYDSASLRVPFLHELSELRRYRFLLWNLVLRDLGVRYKRSVLGFLRAMVNPLPTMVVLLVVFTRLFRFDIEHYAVYILAGILLWNLFARGTSMAMRAVIDNAGILNKIYVPASVFVAAAIGSALVNLLFAFAPLLALAVVTAVRPNLAWFYLPVPILQTMLLAFGTGGLVAALAVFFADIVVIYEVLLDAHFYLTPIIYPVSILPGQLMKFERFNLLFAFIDDFRSPLLLHHIPDPGGVLLTTAAALVGEMHDQLAQAERAGQMPRPTIQEETQLLREKLERCQAADAVQVACTREREAPLEDLQAGLGWRILTGARRLRRRLAPAGSRRDRLVKSLLGRIRS